MFLSSLMAIAAVLIMRRDQSRPELYFVARNAGRPPRACYGLVTALGTGAGAAIFLLWRCWACRRCSPRCQSCLLA